MHILGSISLVFSVIYSVALYAVCAVSLYIIANRCGVKYPWIAFIPIGQYYIIGALCEEYRIFGFRMKPLGLWMCLLFFIQTVNPFIPSILLSLLSIAASILISLILHKFFCLFAPQRAFIYAVLCLFGRLPFAIILFLIKDAPMQMSAGAYPYPFPERPMR